MWRRTGFVYFLMLHQYTITHPISDDGNVRQTRQVDVGDCCPCPGAGDGAVDVQEAGSRARAMLDDAQGVDDCPCRPRHGDAEGASSIFFPTAMRAAGSLLRPHEKKEDLKPLLHPEVDLASSVLETLREATNEEYREALARDAIRDAVKISGLTDPSFNDAAPEESRGIVTIIMHPQQDFDDDDIPQASHIQESRCIHTPLESSRNSFGKLRIEPRPSPLVTDLFRPKSVFVKAKRPGLLHRNLMDIDSNVGASNRHEHVINLDEELMNSRDAGLRSFSLPNLNPRTKSETLINHDNDCYNKNSELKSSTVSTNMISPFFQNVKDKIARLPLDSRFRSKSVLFGNNDPHNLLRSNLEESNSEIKKIIKDVPNFRTPILDSILEKTNPLNVKHLLKPKDVETFIFDDWNKPTSIVNKPFSLNRKNVNTQTVLISNQNRENDDTNSLKMDLNEDCSLEAKEKDSEDIPLNTKSEILDSITNPSNTVFRLETHLANNEKCDSDQTPIENSNERDMSESANGLMPIVGQTQNDEFNASNEDCNEDEDHISHTGVECTDLNPKQSVSYCETDEKYSSRNKNDRLKPDPSIIIWGKNGNSYPEKIFNGQGTRSEAVKSSCETDEKHCSRSETDDSEPDLSKSTCKTNDNHHLGTILNGKSIGSKVIESSCEADAKHCSRAESDDPEPDSSNSSWEMEGHQHPGTIFNAKSTGSEAIKSSCETDEKHCSRMTEENIQPDCYNSDEEHLQAKEQQIIADESIPQESSINEHVVQNGGADTATAKLNLLKPIPLDKTFISIQEKIKSTLENLKNIKKDNNRHLTKDITLNGQDEIQQQKSQQLITTLKPIMLNDIEADKTNLNSVTINELQDKSDLMLQKEAISDNLKKMQCDEDHEMNTFQENVDNLKESHVKESENIGSVNMLNTDQNTLLNNRPKEMNTDSNNIVISKLSRESTPKANLEFTLSDKNIKQTPLDKNQLSTSNNALLDVHDSFNSEPPPIFNDINLTNTVTPNETSGQEEPSQKEGCKRTSSSELNPSMAADASITNFQIKQPPHSLYKENLKEKFQLWPSATTITNMQAPTSIRLNHILGDDVLNSKLPLFPSDESSKFFDIRNHIAESLPRLEDLNDRFHSSTKHLINPPIFDTLHNTFDLSNLKNHAENSVKSLRQKLIAAEGDLNLKKSHNIFESIAEKHEEFNEKLRAVHSDLNDRIESMRNTLINPNLLTHEGRKSVVQSFNDKNSNTKDKQTLLNTHKPMHISTINRSHVNPQGIKIKPITSQTVDRRKLKMPASASMPVPKTVLVPTLKATQAKLTEPRLKNAPILKSNLRNSEPLSKTPEATGATKNSQNSNNDRFKNNIVKVSFPTTSRPELQALKSTPSSTASAIKLLRENPKTVNSRHNGSHKPTIALNDFDRALGESKPLTKLMTRENIDDLPQVLHRKHDSLNDKYIDHLTKHTIPLHSWPRATDNSFLAKVKEAVSARLSKASAGQKLEDKNVELPSLSNKVDNRQRHGDLLRSASENFEINEEEPLKQNVSYRCKMVCTKE